MYIFLKYIYDYITLAFKILQWLCISFRIKSISHTQCPLWWSLCFSFKSRLLLSSAFSPVILSNLEFSECLILFLVFMPLHIIFSLFGTHVLFSINVCNTYLSLKLLLYQSSLLGNLFFFSSLLFRCSFPGPSSLEPWDTYVITLIIQYYNQCFICISYTSLKPPREQSPSFGQFMSPVQSPKSSRRFSVKVPYWGTQ